LVPNEVGLDRAIQAGVKSIAVFTAASESFNQRNIGMSIQQSLDGISKIISTANAHGIKVRGYVSTAFGCPFEGRMDPSQPMKVMKALIDLGIPQVSIGDTIGVASVKGVDELVRPAIEAFGAERLAVHFHDTRGTALVNSFRAFELGIRTFDASVGGLGGCPFAPGASGNLATEDLVYFFKEMGVESGVDYKKLCELSLELARRMGKTVLSSRALQAYQANCQRQSVWDS
jgi:hydroxymethylglutaryl-CoA lyase